MTKTEYARYLRSAHWRELREDSINHAFGCCQRCGVSRWLAELVYDQDLHVHHLTYANLGEEKFGDLEVLCLRCHELETFKRTELRELKLATCRRCGSKHYDRRSDTCPACCNILYGSHLWTVLDSPDPTDTFANLGDRLFYVWLERKSAAWKKSQQSIKQAVEEDIPF